MPKQNIPISIEDFRNSNWQEVIELSEKKECHYCSSEFFKKARVHEEKSDKTNQEIFTILGCLAIVGAVLTIAAFAVFWDGQAQFLAQEGVIGAVMSLILLGSGIVFAGAFG